MKLFEAIKLLSDSGVENPPHDARELFRHVGKMRTEELISRDSKCDLPELVSAVERRCKSPKTI